MHKQLALVFVFIEYVHVVQQTNSIVALESNRAHLAELVFGFVTSLVKALSPKLLPGCVSHFGEAARVCKVIKYCQMSGFSLM